MNREALIHLRRVVEAAPEELLHMPMVMHKASCGTAYCAAGWAALDPWFIDHKFVSTWRQTSDEFANEIIDFHPNSVICKTIDRDGKPVRMGMDFDAAAVYFDITRTDAGRLFGSTLPTYDPHCATKAQVLLSIDRLLAGKPIYRYIDENFPSTIDED